MKKKKNKQTQNTNIVQKTEKALDKANKLAKVLNEVGYEAIVNETNAYFETTGETVPIIKVLVLNKFDSDYNYYFFTFSDFTNKLN